MKSRKKVVITGERDGGELIGFCGRWAVGRKVWYNQSEWKRFDGQRIVGTGVGKYSDSVDKAVKAPPLLRRETTRASQSVQ